MFDLKDLSDRMLALKTKVADVMKRLKTQDLEKKIAVLLAEQESLALAQDFKKIKATARGLKKIQLLYNPWKELKSSLDDLEELVALMNAEASSSVSPDVKMGEEIHHLLMRLEKSYDEQYLLSLFREDDDIRNAYLTIHAGAGGTEACDWAAMLQRTYLRFCERKNFSVRLLDVLADSEAGIRSATLEIKGPYATGILKSESGVHRLVRISPFDAGKRRHTSFASVFVVPEIDDDECIVVNPADVRVDTFRASGAGGQHVNTTDSAVRLTHIPSGIVVSCQMERSQYQNKEHAFKILRARLYERQREEQRQAQQEKEKLQKKIEWGSQIRSYVFHPYQMVKDHRTGHETGDVKRVMDGDLDEFIDAFLKASSTPA